MVHGTGLFLLSAVAGYWVLERASGHKGDVQRVGKVVGWLVILLSFAGIACSLWCAATSCRSAGGGMGFKKGSCPLSAFSSSVPAQPQ